MRSIEELCAGGWLSEFYLNQGNEKVVEANFTKLKGWF